MAARQAGSARPRELIRSWTARAGDVRPRPAEYLRTTSTAQRGAPRGAAKLAAECRARGDDPHADRLQAALVALMFCANCGRPLVDPVSIERGIGPDCWQQIDPAWRARIEARMTAPPVPVQGTLFGDGLGGRP